ncbi:NAD-dependent epimerase/dehydratase family protein [Aquabacterium sp. A7-Y]|uniref:NAD-dependent epimerase/dehydratase family protein n=1 Tax=Aquabacterium sp. A7-Y TaxID=1349605 RepID=UPI00223E7E26|nr:NAD-dependent epimerase/dehydratase family protein [Aquabacterium sp. A7-Y]MCW7538561.1 NAD-dependent epimerase/dehydratase family protein [Aquabacterium sp. A7-Y]
MAVLVTGASGFVGRHLVRALVQRGHEVRALTRAPSAESMVPGVKQVPGDVRDRTALAAAMAGVTTVYHVAGVVPGRGSDAEMWAGNVDGTREVAQSCARAGVRRLVLVSSVAVYRAPLEAVVAEAAPTGGTDLYGRSKSQAESVARLACRGQLELVIARPCQIYGPMDRSGYTQRLLRLSGSPLLPLAGWTGRPFSLIHVSDVADALCAAGEVDGIDGAVFNIAPASRVTLLQLAKIHASLRGRRGTGLRVPMPEAALRAALGLRWTVRNVAQGSGIAFKSYAVGHTHGSLMLGGPLYRTELARAVLAFQAGTTPEQGVSELLTGPAGPGALSPRARTGRLFSDRGSP